MRLVILSVLLAGMAPAVEPAVFSSYLLTVAESRDAPPEVVSIARDYVERLGALNGGNMVFRGAPPRHRIAW